MELTGLLFAIVGIGVVVYPVAFACRAMVRFPQLAGHCSVLLAVWQFMTTVVLVNIGCEYLWPGLSTWPRFLREPTTRRRC